MANEVNESNTSFHLGNGTEGSVYTVFLALPNTYVKKKELVSEQKRIKEEAIAYIQKNFSGIILLPTSENSFILSIRCSPEDAGILEPCSFIDRICLWKPLKIETQESLPAKNSGLQ